MKSGKPKNLHLARWETARCWENYSEIIPVLEQRIAQAQKSIDVEMYIFRLDKIGQPILQSLIAARQRGVRVRLSVDGLGSPEFTPAFIKKLYEQYGLEVKIYKPMRPFFWNLFIHFCSLRWNRLFPSLLTMNRRNHRKLWIFDGTTALVGSANLSIDYAHWRETMAEVSGPDLHLINQSFLWVWVRSSNLNTYPTDKISLPKRLLSKFMWRHRWRSLQTRLRLINQAQTSIRILNPYFVPPYHLLVPLIRAARRGVAVEIMTSRKNDIFFVGWFARRYFQLLLNKQVKIYEHPQTIHSKNMIIDGRALIGSSNYNFRSMNLDLELDVVLTNAEVLTKLDHSWQQDVANSQQLMSAPTSWWWKKFLHWLNPLKRNS